MVFVITHWINLVAMMVLIISGMLIHFPLFALNMGICRGLHLFFGFVIFINCVVRVVLAFFIKTSPSGGTRQQVKDYKTWLPQKDNQHQLIEWIKYYLFLRKTHPLGAKLGVPQKLSYLLIPLLITIMFVTGLCLWGPTMNATAGLTALLGGAMSVRIIHYCVMYGIIMFMFIHIYLANVEGIEPTKLMFFHKEHGGMVYDPESHNIVGEDTLGH